MNDHADGTDTSAFQCAAVYLLTAAGECYRCHQLTPLHALMALPPFSLVGTSAGADDGDGDDALDEDCCMLHDISSMPVALANRIRLKTTDNWRRDHSQTAGETYWMNHCASCGAKQGDFFVHGPNGPFWPNTDAESDAIEAERIEGPFVFPDVGSSYSGAMIDWRDRKHGVVREPLVLKKRASKKKSAS